MSVVKRRPPGFSAGCRVHDSIDDGRRGAGLAGDVPRNGAGAASDEDDCGRAQQRPDGHGRHGPVSAASGSGGFQRRTESRRDDTLANPIGERVAGDERQRRRRHRLDHLDARHRQRIQERIRDDGRSPARQAFCATALPGPPSPSSRANGSGQTSPVNHGPFLLTGRRRHRSIRQRARRTGGHLDHQERAGRVRHRGRYNRCDRADHHDRQADWNTGESRRASRGARGLGIGRLRAHDFTADV